MADRLDRPRHDPYVSGIRDYSDHTTGPGADTDACPWCTALGKPHLPATMQPVPHDPYSIGIRDDSGGAADDHHCWYTAPQGTGWVARWSARLTGRWKSRDHRG